jgi:hypothetical protein
MNFYGSADVIKVTFTLSNAAAAHITVAVDATPHETVDGSTGTGVYTSAALNATSHRFVWVVTPTAAAGAPPDLTITVEQTTLKPKKLKPSSLNNPKNNPFTKPALPIGLPTTDSFDVVLS